MYGSSKYNKKAVDELGNSIVPNDTVIDELKNLSKNYDFDSEDLSIAMAVYMLGFQSYLGFSL